MGHLHNTVIETMKFPKWSKYAKNPRGGIKDENQFLK